MRVYPGVLVVLSAPLIVGGCDLIAVGGSAYYLVAGIALVAAALLLWWKSRWGLWVYGALVLGTVGWTLWESGLDGWAMLPRLVFFSLLGLWLLLPYSRKELRGGPAVESKFLRAASLALIAVVCVPPLAVIVVTGGGTKSEVNVHAPAPAGRELVGWPVYGGTAAGTRFSPLTRINANNVAKLTKVWTYHFGSRDTKSLEVTPLSIGDSLYVCSDSNVVVALNSETGRERWRYDPHIDTHDIPFPVCRGVAYFRSAGVEGECAERVLTNTVDARLIALDARTGALCRAFGTNGQVSLLTGLGTVRRGYYVVTSPPTIVRGRVIVGARVYDGQYWSEPSGVIRAFDVITGGFAWAFDVGRPDRQGEPPPNESYTASTPNSWAPMSADEELGLVYVPMGNTSGSDFYGGMRRPFDEKYSSAVVAIDATSGRPRWSFQTTHHDLWDYDVSSQPTLVDLPATHGFVKALVQPTKRAEIFLLDRETGEPVGGIAERPMPQSGAVPGERVSPTQPFPVGMPSLAGPPLSEARMWGLTPFDQLWCRIKFRESRYDGPNTPPGLSWSIQDPGTMGGTNWGSASVDTDRYIMMVSTSRLVTRVQVLPRQQADALAKPLGVGGKVSEIGGIQMQVGTPYGARIPPFLSPLHVPCQQPPWGLLHAIDLRSHKLLWSRPLGSGRDNGPFNISSGLPVRIGVPIAGGSLVTRSGLTFIAAAVEHEFRAIDTLTGRTLWSDRLPVSGNATPMTYLGMQTGRQFVVIAAGGHMMLEAPNGDSIIAYALP